jgi:hypothetical protein
MSYYTGGDYWMAGGFFSSLGKLGSKVLGGIAGGAQKVLTPLLATAAPVLGAALGGPVGGLLGGRVGELLSPGQAPAGTPVEGTPPLGPLVQQSSFSSGPPLAGAHTLLTGAPPARPSPAEALVQGPLTSRGEPLIRFTNIVGAGGHTGIGRMSSRRRRRY